jgi:hypothetical protein
MKKNILIRHSPVKAQVIVRCRLAAMDSTVLPRQGAML